MRFGNPKIVRPGIPENFKATDMSFVSEQDGDVEKDFKSQIVNIFRSGILVERAFLVRVRYGGAAQTMVALCLEADLASPKEQEDIVNAVHAIFYKMFAATQSIDIVFISSLQLQAILRVAKPFYQQRLTHG
jgi:hypothetical protein